MYSLSNLHIGESNRQGMARTTRNTPPIYPDGNGRADDAYIARLNDLAYAKSEIAYALSIHNS